MIGHSSQRNWLGFAIAMIGALGILSFVLAAASMVSVSSPAWFLAAWGDLLFRSLSFAGLYVPVFLISTGLLIFNGRATPANAAILCLGFVPAISAGITLSLMFSRDAVTAPLPGVMVQVLTLEGAVVVCASIALISLIGLFQLAIFWGKNGRQTDEAETEPRRETTADMRPTAAGSTVEDASPLDRAANLAKQDDTYDESQGIAGNQNGDETGEQDRGPVIEEFRNAMSGKLENKIRHSPPRYADIDAPLNRQESKNLWKDDDVPSTYDEDGEPIPNALAEKIAKGTVPDYKPRRPMFFGGEAAEEDNYLEVYFGKDGNISDYPPSNRKSWVTQADEVEDAVHGPADEELDPTGPGRHQKAAYKGAETTRSNTIRNDAAPTAQGAGGTIQPQHGAGGHPSPEPGEARHVTAGSPGEYRAVSVEGTTTATLVKDVSEDELEPEVTEDSENESELDTETEAEPETESVPDANLLPPMSAQQQVWEKEGAYHVPIQGILDEAQNKEYWLIDAETTRAANTLKATLEEFGIVAEVTGIRKGPVITMFEILPAPGVKLARIVNLSDNIALRLAAQSVRIVAPIPGKHAVGIEIPNRDRAVVSFSELLKADGFNSPKVEIPVALGKDITGDAQIVDLARTPHLLIAGATGSGKSVCVNALICSILYRKTPAEVNMILIDPKIVELKFYNDIPHLLTPVITDPKKAFQALQWCLYEMERRYSLLDAMQVRDIKSYNKKIKTKHIATPKLPYLVVVIDEFADLMATSGKELEGTLARLAAMSRAVGIHLVLATQRPSTDVITGLIKANVPSRIAFMVASKIDSRIIIDSVGAEKLLGKGDMLFTSAWDPFPFRMQGAFLSDEEVERVVNHVKTLGKPDYIDDEIFFEEDEDTGPGSEEFEGGEDPLMKEAIDIVVSAKKASASYLQRRLKIGYNRAARMVEQMEEMGIVGPQNGSKAREILRMYQ